MSRFSTKLAEKEDMGVLGVSNSVNQDSPTGNIYSTTDSDV
ncbi:hypothetical protein [Moorena producens]